MVYRYPDSINTNFKRSRDAINETESYGRQVVTWHIALLFQNSSEMCLNEILKWNLGKVSES